MPSEPDRSRNQGASRPKRPQQPRPGLRSDATQGTIARPKRGKNKLAPQYGGEDGQLRGSSSGIFTLDWKYLIPPPIDSFEPNNTQETATPLNGRQNHTVSGIDDVDWFVLSVEQEVVKATMSMSSEAPVKLEVMGDDGSLYTIYGGPLYLPRGDTFFRVSTPGGTVFAEYSIDVVVESVPPDAYEPDDDLQSAITLGRRSILRRTLAGSDLDWMSITLAVPDEVSVSISAEWWNRLPLDVSIMDESGSLISQQSGTEIEFTLETGTWYLVASTTTPYLEYVVEVTPIFSPDAYESDDILEAAHPILPGQSQDRTIHSTEDVDWILLDLDAEFATVTFEYSGYTSAKIGLYAMDASLVVESYGNTIRQDLARGKWFFKVSDGFEPTDYVATLSTLPLVQDPYEPNDTLDTSTPIEISETQTHKLIPYDDVDWIAFDLVDDSIASITITPSSTNDPQVELYSGLPEFIKLGELSSGTNSIALTAGTYHCKISEGGPYSVSIEASSILPDSFEPDNGQQARDFTGERIRGSIYPPGDEDWIRFEVGEISKVSAFASGNGLPNILQIRMVDENLSTIEQSVRLYEGRDLSTFVPPGKYYLIVSTPGFILQDYELSVNVGSANPQQIYGSGAGPFALDFSPDGRFMATAGARGCAIWDLASNDLLRVLRGHTEPVRRVAFSSDGTRLATVGEDSKIKIWDFESGVVLGTLYPEDDRCTIPNRRVLFSNDGDHLLVAGGCGDRIDIYSVTDFNRVGFLNGQDFALANDDSFVLFSHYRSYPTVPVPKVTIGTYDLRSGAIVDQMEFEPNLMQTYGGYPSPNSSVVSGNTPGKIWLALTTGYYMPYSPSVTQYNFLEVDLLSRTALAIEPWPPTGYILDSPNVMAIDPTGRKVIVHGQYFDTVRRTSTPLPGSFVDAAFLPSGVLGLADDKSQRVRMFEVDGLSPSGELGRHSPPIDTMLLPSSSVLATNKGDLWNIDSGEPIHRTDADEGVLSPDAATRYTAYREYDFTLGRTIAINVRIYDVLSGVQTGEYRLTDIVDSLQPGAYTVYNAPISLKISPDGLRMIGDRYMLNIWNARTGENLVPIALPAEVLPPYSGTYDCRAFKEGTLDFAPDGLSLIGVIYDECSRRYSFAESFFHKWDAATGLLREESLPGSRVVEYGYGSDGIYFLRYYFPVPPPQYPQIQELLVDAVADEEIPNPQSGAYRSAGLISPSRTLGYSIGGGELVNLPSGGLIKRLAGHTDYVTAARFSEDERNLFTGSGDGTVMSWELSPPRAIVVAGGGPYEGNSIARQTHDLSAYTYRTLLGRGYNPDNILFLSAFPDGTPLVPGGDPVSWDVDGDGLDDVDGLASRAALEGALAGPFGREAGRLLILMMDHGYRTGDTVAFRINPTEAVTTRELNGWLDAMQNAAPVDLTLVVDCCYSGQFAIDCAKSPAIPAGRERIVIASTTPNTEAVFLPAPDLTSFMHTFLSSAYMGNSFGEAFRSGARLFRFFPVAGQEPRLHDGQTLHTAADLFESPANNEFFGATWSYGTQSEKNINDFFPSIASVSPSGTVAPGQPVTLRAVTLPFQNPERITATILPPAPTVLSGDPVVGLPRVELTRVGGSTQEGWTWEATVSPGDANFPFTEEGAYRATFTARFGSNRVSDPFRTQFTVTSGPDPDAATIRAVLAFGDGDAVSSPALASAADYAYSVHLERFQSPNGDRHPEWITLLTNHATTLNAKALRPREVHAAAARVRKGAEQPLTAASLLGAIAARGAEADRLYIHLATGDAGDGVLRLTGTETLSAAALDAALDSVQALVHQPEVIVVLDAAGSGSFIAALRATAGQRRLVLTSAAAGECGIFLADPPVTYTHKLLGPLWGGVTYAAAHESAANFFTNFVGNFAGTRLQPQLDDAQGGVLARSRWLGRRYAFAGDEASGLPFVVEAEVVPPVEPGARPVLRARLMEGVEPATDPAADPLAAYRVFARVTPRGLVCGTSAGSLPQIRLRRDSPTAWTWSAPVSDLIQPGVYPVTFVAEYSEGENVTRESVPVFRTLELGGAPDAFEPDNAAAIGTALAANGDDQTHTLHATGDEDWYRLLLNGRDTNGQLQTIPYTLRFADVVLPEGTQLQVTVALDGGTATLPSPNECQPTLDTLCAAVTSLGREITLPTNGVDEAQLVLVRIALLGTPADPAAPVSYDIDLYRSTGANNGIVASIGTVTDNRKADRIVAHVTLNAGGSFVSGRASTWADIEGVRLTRYIVRNDELVGEPALAGEWPVTQPRFPTCQAGTESLADAISFEDDGLTGLLQHGDLVAYFVSVVIGGVEVPCDMLAQPAGAVYVSGQTATPPSCTPSTAPFTVTPLSVSRSVAAGQPVPDAALEIRNNGSETLQWSAGSDAAWVTVGASSGSTAAGAVTPLILRFDTTGLAPATTPYEATISITGAGSPTPVAVDVLLTLTPRSEGWIIR